MPVQAPRHLFTVREFDGMVRSGVFHEDDRVELLAGEVIEMTPIGSPHAGCVNALTNRLTAQLGSKAIVSVQNPVVLDDYSEPQPDLLVLQPRADFYRSAHPRPADVWLLIEVSDSSVEFDRRDKLPHYARSGIREVWIVDLAGSCVDRFEYPSPDGYRETARFVPGERVTSPFLTVDVAVSDLL